MKHFHPIIFVPFAFAKDTRSGMNISAKGREIINLYLKNAAVALCSAKHYNPTTTVALVTNLSANEIPEEFLSVFKQHEIVVLHVPFDRFVFDKNYLWSLAFYKLCALSHLLELEYTHFCYLDTDVFVQASLESLWQEADKAVLLYDINHNLTTKDYLILVEEMQVFLKTRDFPTHFGGEFFAASKSLAKRFVDRAIVIYQDMRKTHFQTTKGDEFILSATAFSLREYIKPGGGYIFRFWTGPNFRLISTCYKYNAVAILHLPAEKERGFFLLYKKYILQKKFPSNEMVWKICRITSQPIMDTIKMDIINLADHLKCKAWLQNCRKNIKRILQRSK